MKGSGAGDRPSGAGWLRHRVTPEEAGSSVEEILRGRMEISRRMLQRLTRSRGLSVNGRTAHLERRVRAGDVVAARLADRAPGRLVPVRMELEVVHEDADLIVVEKPAGILVHPTSPRHDRTLAHAVAHRLAARGETEVVRPIHRLDRETSGLIAFAKSGYAHQHLDRQLRRGELVREYLVLVEGSLAAERGSIREPIARSNRNPTLRAVDPSGEEAITHFEVVERRGNATLARVRLETGRTHQIRVHFAHLGHPVVGDSAYGAKPLRNPRIALHSARLAFRHPRSGERLDLVSELPAELQALSGWGGPSGEGADRS